MKNGKLNIHEEQKNLVLARLKTLNPESKLLMGGGKEVSVRELIQHVENSDSFGKKVVDTQIKMLKILTEVS